jgi:CRISPR-associated protein Cas6
MERPVDAADREVVDVAFDLAAESLPAENAGSLARAIEGRLPWFAGEALAGVHPLRASPTGYGLVLLARRAKLVLRVPAERLGACLALEGAVLDIDGSTLAVGVGRARPLRGAATISAHRVASAAADTHEFEREMRAALAALAVGCELIAGRRRHGMADGRAVAGFALSLVGLTPVESLRLQHVGLGGERRLGWGVFVPAKAITLA